MTNRIRIQGRKEFDKKDQIKNLLFLFQGKLNLKRLPGLIKELRVARLSDFLHSFRDVR